MLTGFSARRHLFSLTATDTLNLPEYKGSTLRGGFGHAFRKVVCTFRGKQCDDCLLRHRCVYSYVFETPPPEGADLMNNQTVIPLEDIEERIFLIRNQKVMLSFDLAELYGVEPRVLVQAVKRNIERFPEDFMFQLSRQEFGDLKSQIVISSWGGIRRATPYAFTEQGVAMLSGVLKSPRAVKVNVEIMRAFVRLRRLLSSNEELSRKLDALEKKYDTQFRLVFDAIRQLMMVEEPRKTKSRNIGFRTGEGK